MELRLWGGHCTFRANPVPSGLRKRPRAALDKRRAVTVY
jgi:hypothetical protein